ncbi:MAG: hypothetical protein INR72_16065 [Williamsia herbipolensis]|nr:hypothetical protein [Williamsia herbipolensis]
MTIGRVVSAVTATAAVVGGAVLVLNMSHTADRTAADGRRPHFVEQTSRPAYLPLTVGATHTPSASSSPRARTHTSSHPAGRDTGHAVRSSSVDVPVSTRSTSRVPVTPVTHAVTPSSTPATTSAAPHTSSAPTTSHAAPSTTASSTTAPATTSAPPTTASSTHSQAPVTPKQHDSGAGHKPRGHKLPLDFKTHNAHRVITIVADSTWSTTATFQAWHKVRGGWAKRGGAVVAHVGSQGLSHHASESKSATPIGSFTLTHAFGHDRNPGTKLPYFKTNPNDWWISQSGPLYNTHQRCSSGCNFTQGSPNEHLYYETPYYNYAVVIDYNTRNSPTGVRQGRGSAFFLHVTDGNPTAGCVSIPQAKLKRVMRWLKPGAHPRILIGVR